MTLIIKKISFLLCSLLFFSFIPADLPAVTLQDIKKLTGDNDSVLVTDSSDNIIIAVNENKKLIPASILKLLTSLAALNYLGENYRFKTDIFIDDHQNMIIKGYGDPMFISESINNLAYELSLKLKKRNITAINDIILDDSYFVKQIRIPGRSKSYEPYDAPNGALNANFNTVFFRQNKNGEYISAEPQTPLLPFVIKRIKASALKKGRIMLTENNSENTLYSGHLLKYFLKQHGIICYGEILTGKVDLTSHKLFFQKLSEYSVTEAIQNLLRFSNNFMANQILISMGSEVYGPPGTLEKGIKAVKVYAARILKINNIQIVEGSGISRKNRITASSMDIILKNCTNYQTLFRQNKNEFYKTGTLKGVNTRAGYIISDFNSKGKNRSVYRFIIMINTPDKSAEKILKKIKILLNI